MNAQPDPSNPSAQLAAQGPSDQPASSDLLRRRNPIGAHVPVAGRGLVGTGLAYADLIGAEAVQVFVANPRGWATPAGNPAQDRAFREECERRDLPAYVHAPYLINFGSATAATRERSGESLRHSLVRGRAIGARGVVVHTGSAIGAGRRAEAMAQVRADMRPLLDQIDSDDLPDLLLEPTAGQGESLCSRIEDLAAYAETLDFHPRLGVCLDTCHVFAAGHDLAAPGGVADALDLLERVLGPGRLKLVHANDSKDVVGARKDRHANIGDGEIGEAAFAELLHHPATAGVPFILETPDRSAAPGFGHAEDVTTLKRLRAVQGHQALLPAAEPHIGAADSAVGRE